MKMKKYKGVKEVNAKPMNRLQYNKLRGWILPENENGSDEDFLVEDLSNKPNIEGYKGYIQWLPKENFEASYNLSNTFKDRLTLEFNELAKNYIRLCDFLDSDNFNDIVKSTEVAALLVEQREVMKKYLDILDERIGLANTND